MRNGIRLALILVSFDISRMLMSVTFIVVPLHCQSSVFVDGRETSCVRMTCKITCFFWVWGLYIRFNVFVDERVKGCCCCVKGGDSGV